MSEHQWIDDCVCDTSCVPILWINDCVPLWKRMWLLHPISVCVWLCLPVCVCDRMNLWFHVCMAVLMAPCVSLTVCDSVFQQWYKGLTMPGMVSDVVGLHCVVVPNHWYVFVTLCVSDLYRCDLYRCPPPSMCDSIWHCVSMTVPQYWSIMTVLIDLKNQDIAAFLEIGE